MDVTEAPETQLAADKSGITTETAPKNGFNDEFMLLSAGTVALDL